MRPHCRILIRGGTVFDRYAIHEISFAGRKKVLCDNDRISAEFTAFHAHRLLELGSNLSLDLVITYVIPHGDSISENIDV